MHTWLLLTHLQFLHRYSLYFIFFFLPFSLFYPLKCTSFLLILNILQQLHSSLLLLIVNHLHLTLRYLIHWCLCPLFLLSPLQILKHLPPSLRLPRWILRCINSRLRHLFLSKLRLRQTTIKHTRLLLLLANLLAIKYNLILFLHLLFSLLLLHKHLQYHLIIIIFSS